MQSEGAGLIPSEAFDLGLAYRRGSLVAQMVKNPPAMQEAWVRSLGQKDPLEKGTATHSNILAWRIPCTEEPNELQSLASRRAEHDWVTNTHTVAEEKENEISEV